MEIKKIILGSQSPRRREYIQHLSYPVEIVVPEVDEVYPKDLPLVDVPEYLALLKANALTLSLLDGEVLITTDTVVILDDELLGKPEDEAQAIELLTKLSGKTHKVVSGVLLRSRHKTMTFRVITSVTFAELSSTEIEKYVSEYKPLDKAGAYGIQEYIGFIGVEKIDGSYMNVIGLPLAQIREQLKQI